MWNLEAARGLINDGGGGVNRAFTDLSVLVNELNTFGINSRCTLKYL